MPEFLEILVFCLWFVGGFISGLTGMGGSMVIVPIAALFIPIHDVVAISCISCVAMDIAIAAMHYKFCKFRVLVPMVLGSLPGAVLGVYLLQVLSGNVLQSAVGVLLLCYVYWQFTMRSKAKTAKQDTNINKNADTINPIAGTKKDTIAGATAGFGAGLLGSAISFDGPPVAMYGIYAKWQPRVFISTIAVFFVIRALVTCVLQAQAGFYTPDVMNYVLYSIPAVVLGSITAYPLVKRFNPDVFKGLLLFLISMCGIVCLSKALW